MNFFTIRKVKWCVINRYKENKGQGVYNANGRMSLRTVG